MEGPMRRLLIVIVLTLPAVARADDSIKLIEEKATAEWEAIRKEDAAEKRELRALLDGSVLRDEARAAELMDQILSNGSRAAEVMRRRATELRKLMTPAEFAKLVSDGGWKQPRAVELH
jgi:hypothetical protein